MVDVRPDLEYIKLYAEFLQAESEELALASSAKTPTASPPPAPNANAPANPVLKAFADQKYQDGKPGGFDKKKTSSMPCRFWVTEEGCRRGSGCSFAHSWEGITKTNRCFQCSGVGHAKKDCPIKVKDPAAPKVAASKMVKGREEDGKKAAEGFREATSGVPEPPKETVTGGAKASVGATKPTVNGSTAAGSGEDLIKEVTGLLKTMRAAKFKVKQICYGEADADQELALLDGGATHPLRQARPEELTGLVECEVELACGTAVMYKHKDTIALLTKEPVEPIVPLRTLVEAGFVINWTAKGCRIEHRRLGRLDCWLRSGCPVMERKAAMKLLDFLDSAGASEWATNDEEWWRSRFPELPKRVLAYMMRVTDEGETNGRCPFNLRLRRRWESGRGVVIHLFSGKDGRQWRKTGLEGFEVITVDVQEDSRQDLHNPALWGYLWKLAEMGLIKAVIGGPPCRTVSRLRHIQPGAPPLRGRDDLRFGLPGISAENQQKVDGDTALFFKQVGLWLKAMENKPPWMPDIGFLQESPMDPMKYVQEPRAGSIPSFWNFPEIIEFGRERNMKMVDLDQGACGHQRRKPTTLLTNLPGMEDLAGMKGEGREELEKDLEGRLRQSREWAAWAPGMVAAIKASLQIYLRNISQMNHVKVKKAMSLEQWKQHVHRGHVPFDRRCRMCLQEAGVDRPHRRLKAAVSAYVLNVDITGPFVAGSDVGTGKKVKYALVATVAIPVKEVTPGPGEADGEEDEELRGEREHQGEPGDTADPGDHAAEDEALEGLECDDEEPRVSDAVAEAVNVKVRDEMKDALRGYQVQNVTAVEPLESRKTKDVLLALGLLFSKYRSMGIPLYRMHCDRAKEFLAKPVRQWCAERNMILTLTGGDDHAANGRVEGEICQLKRRLRVTLKASGAPIRLWPTAIRHVALERMQDQLKSLGITPMPMLPYYAQVMVKTKRWHKSGGLAAPFKQVRLLGPSPTMMWGWVVQTAEGNVQHAWAAILPEPLADRAMYELTIDPNPEGSKASSPGELLASEMQMVEQHKENPLYDFCERGGSTGMVMKKFMKSYGNVNLEVVMAAGLERGGVSGSPGRKILEVQEALRRGAETEFSA